MKSLQNAHRSGLTLVEVVLALGLTVVVVTLITASIHLHLRVLNRGREDIERTQLARVLLQRIGADLQSAVPYEPLDTAALMPAMSMSGGSGLPSDMGGLPEGLEDIPDQGGTSSTIAQRSSSDTSMVADMPVGLYGTSNWLQVDTSRLPRPDQMVGTLNEAYPTSDGTLVDRPSDVKTVAYFVAEPKSDGSPGGLVRREMDRAATSWAAQQGTLTDIEEQLQPLAPEVAAVEFRYFDGYEFFDYWDMAERNALPVAVEILLQMKAPEQPETSAMLFGSTTEPATDSVIYRLVVRLPTAYPTSADESTESTSS
ncbi:MAG: hypothetical protein JW818_00395, partial [Pirellulales bacterium]|nr:hypothetical protein [Pirellulales bacterium]